MVGGEEGGGKENGRGINVLLISIQLWWGGGGVEEGEGRRGEGLVRS